MLYRPLFCLSKLKADSKFVYRIMELSVRIQEQLMVTSRGCGFLNPQRSELRQCPHNLTPR